MRQSFLPFLMLALLVSTGCTSHSHYYQKKDEIVIIFLKKPGVSNVYFLSSLDGYKPRKALRVDNQTWQIEAPAKTEFRYFYRVDGTVYLPACRFKEQDDFGSETCIYAPEL
jgi:hypothetical protein